MKNSLSLGRTCGSLGLPSDGPHLHPHTHTLTLTHSRSHTHILTLTHSHTQTHTLTLTDSHTHTHTLTLTHCLSWSGQDLGELGVAVRRAVLARLRILVPVVDRLRTRFRVSVSRFRGSAFGFVVEGEAVKSNTQRVYAVGLGKVWILVPIVNRLRTRFRVSVFGNTRFRLSLFRFGF